MKKQKYTAMRRGKFAVKKVKTEKHMFNGHKCISGKKLDEELSKVVGK